MAGMHLIITGAVQGVGFRYAMCVEARRRRLAGWVRNCADGTVEAVAVGDQAALEQLVQWARRGPPAAQVEQVQTHAASAAQLGDIDEPFGQRGSA